MSQKHAMLSLLAVQQKWDVIDVYLASNIGHQHSKRMLFDDAMQL